MGEYDRGLLVLNIRNLFKKNPQVKLGDIEKMGNVRQGYLSTIERSPKRKPNLNFLLAVTKTFNVTLEDLMTTTI